MNSISQTANITTDLADFAISWKDDENERSARGEDENPKAPSAFAWAVLGSIAVWAIILLWWLL